MTFQKPYKVLCASLQKKRKMVASKFDKVVKKPRKKKIMHQNEVQKEVQEMASITVLMPTKTRNRATSKTP